MLKTSSSDYTTTLPQWLGVRYATTKCLPDYMAAIDTISNGIHTLYLYVQAKSNNADPAVIKQLEGTGGNASPSASGAEMKAFAQSQVTKWKQVVRETNIPLQ